MEGKQPFPESQLASFERELERVNSIRDRYRRRLSEASKNQAHHQGCPIGGLWIMGSADCSGSPCWCGASARAQQRTDRICERNSALAKGGT